MERTQRTASVDPSEFTDEPRAICALSEDRQWLVVTQYRLSGDWFIFYRCIDPFGQTPYVFDHTQPVRDTGQDAHEVLREWLEGRG